MLPVSTAALTTAAVHLSPVPRVRLTDWRFVVAIVAIGALMLAVSLRTARQVERDALVINVAGRQRMLVQKATAEYLAGIVAVVAPQEGALGATARRFEGALAALTDGGVATFDDRVVLLQPATSRAFRAALEEAGAGWEELRRVLDRHPSDWDGNATARRLAELSRLTGRTVALMDHAVRVYEKEASARAARLHGIQLALMPLWFGLLGIGLVGERRALASEAELREQETLGRALTRYQELFATVPVGVYRTMPDGTILDANPAMAEMLGFPDRDALMAVPATVLYVDPADRDRWRAVMEREGVVRGFEVQMRRRDGRVIWVRDTARAVRDAAARVAAYEGTAEDITERKRAEQERQRLSTVIEQASDMVMITDARGDIEYVNPAFERVTGYARDEVLGRNPRLLKSGRHDAAFYRSMWDTLSQDEVFSARVVNSRKDGATFRQQATIFPLKDGAGQTVSYACVARDVTHETLLEDQLRQAQKMEAVGRLAGGVAHDFNNLLTIIISETQIAQDESVADSDVRESLRAIRSAGESAAVLTRQLLTFSRRQVLNPAVFAINDFVTQTEWMLRRLIGEDVEVVMNLAPGAGRVKVDHGQLEQVLVNLAVNARDAMHEGGRLLLETANATLDADSAATHGGMPPAEYVVVTVSDTGTGMSEEVKSRAFEPFFTTKGDGQGTGLGLATSYAIVKQCRGHIAIYSEPGLGTTMRIYLPRVYERDSDALSVGAPSPRGSETVLLVEDDATLRAVTARILSAYGYSVLQAGGGAEALQLLAAHPQAPVDLLMTDVVMPGMGGGELAKRVRAASNGIKVLFTSGYPDDVVMRQLLGEPGIVLLQKPFTTEVLAGKVRAVLDAKSA